MTTDLFADPVRPAVWGLVLRPLACWDCGLESCQGHERLSLVSVVCCQVEFASGWSLVQRSPNECSVSECDRKASIMGRPWPNGGCFAPWIKQTCSLWGTNCIIMFVLCGKCFGVVSWFRQLVASLSSRSLGFDSRSIHVRCVVEKVTLLSEYFCFPSQYNVSLFFPSTCCSYQRVKERIMETFQPTVLLRKSGQIWRDE